MSYQKLLNLFYQEKNDQEERREKEIEKLKEKRRLVAEKYQTITPEEAYQKNANAYPRIDDKLQLMVEEGKKIVRVDMSMGLSAPPTYIHRINYIDPEKPDEIVETTFYVRDNSKVKQEKEDIF